MTAEFLQVGDGRKSCHTRLAAFLFLLRFCFDSKSNAHVTRRPFPTKQQITSHFAFDRFGCDELLVYGRLDRGELAANDQFNLNRKVFCQQRGCAPDDTFID